MPYCSTSEASPHYPQRLYFHWDYSHWAWGGIVEGPAGWLAARGFVDFAGSTVVHSVGGWAALAVLMCRVPKWEVYAWRARVKLASRGDSTGRETAAQPVKDCQPFQAGQRLAVGGSRRKFTQFVQFFRYWRFSKNRWDSTLRTSWRHSLLLSRRPLPLSRRSLPIY